MPLLNPFRIKSHNIDIEPADVVVPLESSTSSSPPAAVDATTLDAEQLSDNTNSMAIVGLGRQASEGAGRDGKTKGKMWTLDSLRIAIEQNDSMCGSDIYDRV
jgi:hypothetical protein